jgi:hypothetical protein
VELERRRGEEGSQVMDMEIIIRNQGHRFLRFNGFPSSSPPPPPRPVFHGGVAWLLLSVPVGAGGCGTRGSGCLIVKLEVLRWGRRTQGGVQITPKLGV